MSYAHVNVWSLSKDGASWDATAAREMGERLRREPGFHFYALIRTAESEAVAVTVFASAQALEAALVRIAPFVRETIRPLTSGEPERRQGPVIYATTTSEELDTRAA